VVKNRLTDPSEIRALDFKDEFRQFAICPVSATIDVDWSILKISGKSGVIRLVGKMTVQP
jgi:hypothetical protein